MLNINDTVTLKLVESTIRPGCWKVWAKTSTGAGYIRQGFAWKTRRGAEKAAARFYPGANLIS